MNWKEFFKPTRFKVILALLILSYPFIALLIVGGVDGICMWDFACKIVEYTFYALTFPMFILDLHFYELIGWVVHVLYSYLLSCLIIFIYKKIKFKEKKK